MFRIHLAILASAFVAAPALAADPVGTGNFRRAEAIQAAKVSPSKALVMGIAIANEHTSTTIKQPRDARVLAVSDQKSGKVVLVKAPIDKSEPVTVLTTKQANAMGLVTQRQAEKQARTNGGLYGTGTVKVKPTGLAWDGYGYAFEQKTGLGFHPKNADEMDHPKEVVTAISRTITFSGKGESATPRDFKDSPAIRLVNVLGPTGKMFVKSKETGGLFLKDQYGTYQYVRPLRDSNQFDWMGLTPADIPAGYLK